MPDQTALLAGYIMPHPPVIVPGVSRETVKAVQTVKAMQQLSDDLARLKPDTVVLISPHAPAFSDYLFLYDGLSLYGDLESFGAPGVSLSFEQDQPLHERLISRFQDAGISAGILDDSQMRRFKISHKLDHGAVVPLYFLRQAAPFRLVVMASASMPLTELYEAGRQIRMAAEDLQRRVIIVASGDQSHKANAASPYGSCPEGDAYDRQLVTALKQHDLTAILAMDPVIRERAAECGYRSIVMLSGAFSSIGITSTVLSYEAPYGIGYCVARLQRSPEQPAAVSDAMQEALQRRREQVRRQQAQASVPVRIARQTLESKIRHGKEPDLHQFHDLAEQNPYLNERSGVFVSLKKHGDLRGCIGTTSATTTSVLAEIVQNAVSAALHDPRFEPVRIDELADISISVDILGPSEPIASADDLDPAIYGVIVRSGSRTGLLLPDLDGVETADDQIAIARRKAGIRPEDPIHLERFRVTRYV